MTKEEIEKEAQDYVDSVKYTSYWLSFIAGAESRQKEIDELVEALKTVIISPKMSDLVTIKDFCKVYELIKKYEK